MSEKKKKQQAAATLAAALVEEIKVADETPVFERIKYPLIWERITSGYRIQDLQPTKFEEAIYLIKEYYIKEETLCKGINLVNDEEAVNEYLGLVNNWLKDTQSLAAIEDGSGSMVGVLIGRLLDRTVRSHLRHTALRSERLIKMHKIQAHLMKKNDVLDIYNVLLYYNVYVLLVSPQHREKGVAKALIRSAMDMSKKLQSSVIGGLFSSKIAQNIVYKEGFKVHDEICLSEWTENDEEVFKEVDGKENSVAFMAVRLKDPPPPPPNPPTDPPRRHPKSTKKSQEKH